MSAKTEVSKTLSRVEVFENGGSASLCGRAKTEVFEYDYVTGIGMFSYPFSVVKCGRSKMLQKNASVDEKLFIRFQETENGGFRKRISADRACFYTTYTICLSVYQNVAKTETCHTRGIAECFTNVLTAL